MIFLFFIEPVKDIILNDTTVRLKNVKIMKIIENNEKSRKKGFLDLNLLLRVIYFSSNYISVIYGYRQNN
ncbi:unnamed protein product, partial [marine sediment metagenome]